MMKKNLLLAIVVAGALTMPRAARACGCFAPPNPAVPVVQAGERILFVLDGGMVTAHIQIQYAGKAEDFGWLLPVPAIPEKLNKEPGIDVGVDELFTQLITTTQPRYDLRRISDCQRASAFAGCVAGAASSAAPEADLRGAPNDDRGPLVVEDTAGPFVYAILKADDKTEMFKWLSDHRYFVPAGTEAASDPYIRPGAYFVALKLQAGRDAGDLQPIVLRYKSDLPMIPIILTQVAANPDMGIQVWLLGQGRAIPRNYRHTILNDAQIDWFGAATNYNDVVIAATKEADGRHTFVTEYAGSSSVMRDVLDAPGRFTHVKDLDSVADPQSYLSALLGLPLTQGPQLFGILSGHIPMPEKLRVVGVRPAQYYTQFSTFLHDAMADAEVKAKLDRFDPVALTKEIIDRIVTPTLNAGALFRTYPYLTRLYTTLSPEQMNSDPVFSYNRELPDVSNVHRATLTTHCDNSGTLVTEQGFKIEYSAEDLVRLDSQRGGRWEPLPLPYSRSIEVLRDTGAPQVVRDNSEMIAGYVAATGGGGCAASDGNGASARGALLLFFGAALLFGWRRRRLTRA